MLGKAGVDVGDILKKKEKEAPNLAHLIEPTHCRSKRKIYGVLLQGPSFKQPLELYHPDALAGPCARPPDTTDANELTLTKGRNCIFLKCSFFGFVFAVTEEGCL